MLSDELKASIQKTYSELLAAKGYRPRHCQKQMIADIANTLGNVEADDNGKRTNENHLCVVEAGTGTGKTLAYMLASMPIVKSLGKRLVVSTATIALQEQIVRLDLPDIQKHTRLEFSFALAKGRRRYLCLARLHLALRSLQPTNQTLAFYDDEFEHNEDHHGLYESMLTSLDQGEWDGDRDNWSHEIDHNAWGVISTDYAQCTGRQCSYYENCHFYKARERIHRVDCIVANHDLVLADLMMGGGAVLPVPEDSIYIFDEGHHLPAKAMSHFANFLPITSSQNWLEQVPQSLDRLASELGDSAGLPGGLSKFSESISHLVSVLEDIKYMLAPLRDQAEGNAGDLCYRFPHGKVGTNIREISHNLHLANQQLLGQLQQLEVELQDGMATCNSDDKRLFEFWLLVIAAFNARTHAIAKLCQDYQTADVEQAAPRARWVSFRDDDEVILHASPVTVDDLLYERLWSRAFAGVITSATLALGADFSRFQTSTGISPEHLFRSLGSPFKYAEQAVLRIPVMAIDPRSVPEHNQLVIELLPQILADVTGGLVLFASWRQLRQVLGGLDEAFMKQVLCQGTLAKTEIIAVHKQRVDADEPSIIFGLASFAEGIDLPGKYCEHVVIIKIPFAVPDDPIGATLSEWIESKGGNAFEEIMVPDAALRMVQACGRLLRTETDQGVVTIMDRRLVTHRYGSVLLAALPPFRREIGCP